MKELIEEGMNLKYGMSLSYGDIFLNLFFCLVVASFIYWTYRKTYTGVVYSRDYNLSIFLVSLITCLIIMIISGNLILSLGMVGALSIVRFRAAIKEPLDIVYMFWALAAGIGSGVGFYKITLCSSALIGLTIFILKNRFPLPKTHLLILYYEGLKEEELLRKLSPFFKHCQIKSRQYADGLDELVLEVKLQSKDEKELGDNLRNVEGIKKFLTFSDSSDKIRFDQVPQS